jgi:hypothetical protein
VHIQSSIESIGDMTKDEASRRFIGVCALLFLPSCVMASDLTKTAERLLREQDTFIVSEVLSENPVSTIPALIAFVVALFSIVGLAVGAAGGWRQACASAVKIPLLQLGTFMVCFPVMILGSLMTGTGLTASEIIRFILLGLTTEALVMVSLAPIIVFFPCQSRYDFSKLLIVASFALSAVVSMFGLIDAMAVLSAVKGVLPKDSIWLFKIWIASFGFVGMQMAWMLRACIGSPELKFEWLRPRGQGGNFYTAVMVSVINMFSGDPALPPENPINSGE